MTYTQLMERFMNARRGAIYTKLSHVVISDDVFCELRMMHDENGQRVITAPHSKDQPYQLFGCRISITPGAGYMEFF